MNNNCLTFLFLTALAFSSFRLSAQEAYIDENNFGKYVARGYADKKFIPSGKMDKSGMKQGKWTDYQFSEVTAFLKDGAGYAQKEGVYFLKAVGSYKDNKRTGTWKFYLLEEPSKKQVLLREAAYSEGTTEGPLTLYFPSGKVQYAGTYKNGAAHGVVTMFFENGQKQFETSCVNGAREGECKAFYRNGALASTSFYKNDSLSGTMTSYYADGKLQQISNYRSGTPDGIYRYYYDNGQLWTERFYENDKLIRVSVLVDRNGNPLEKGTFENGDGYLYLYDENGKPYAKHLYKDGVKISGEDYTSEPDWFKR